MVSNDSGAGESQSAEDNPLVDLVLLLMGPISDEIVDVPTTKASNYTFSDGLDLHEGYYFNSKKELKRKLFDVALKGNFEFRTRKWNM